MFRFFVVLIVFVLSSCQVNPVKISPEMKKVPAKFSMYSPTPDYSVKWWKSLGSRELDGLIEIALKNNLTITEIWARLKQARVEAFKAGSAKLPSLEYDTDAEFKREKEKGSKADATEDYALGLTLSYEIDLWSRISSEQREASLSLRASREDLDAAVLSLSGEVASCWTDLISTKRQIRYLEEQLGINKGFLKLIEIRFSNSTSTALDLYQQRQAIEAIKASLIQLKHNRKLLKNQLALLIGKAPGAEISLNEKIFPSIKEVPEVGVPADILSVRPDVRAAGLRLKSAGWAVAAAKADRLPKLSISASYTYGAEKIKDIFNNWLWNLAANITGPIFDGGYRKAEVERTRYVVEEKIALYKKTVITAIKEVEDSIAEEKQSFQTLSSINKRINLAEKIVKETEYRYLRGVGDLFSLIREKLTYLDLVQNRIVVEADLIKARVGLYKSLGGTWMNKIGRD